MMNEIEELLKKCCADGVVYKKLQEVAEIGTGSHNTNEGIENGKYVFYVRSQEPLTLDSYDFDETAIITAGDGVGVGKVFHYVEGKYALHQRAYRIHITDNTLLPKFFFQYMKATFLRYIEMEMYHGSVPSIRRPMLNAYPVPIPPIEVQEKIVTILDKFSSLENALETELELRKKQYEYYRNSLFEFEGEVKTIYLKDACRIVAGGDAPKMHMSQEKSDLYSIPIFSNGIGENALYGYTDEAKVNEECVTIAARGTIGWCALRKQPFYPIVRLICVIPNKELIHPAFLYYFLKNQVWQVPDGGIPQLTVPMISKLEIPLPSLEKQEEVVRVLDVFNEICTDENCGLPAEIKARHRQYEYYREKLLAFDK